MEESTEVKAGKVHKNATVRSMHDHAMDLAWQAIMARRGGDSERVIELYREALVYERRAAALVPDSVDSEPTRGIMYRSAASLAYQCGEFAQALELIDAGLSGAPVAQTKYELEELRLRIEDE